MHPLCGWTKVTIYMNKFRTSKQRIHSKKENICSLGNKFILLNMILRRKYSTFVFPMKWRKILKSRSSSNSLFFWCFIVNHYILLPGRIQVLKNLFPVILQQCSCFRLASFSLTWRPNWPLEVLGLCFYNSFPKMHSHWLSLPILVSTLWPRDCYASIVMYLFAPGAWEWNHCLSDHMKGRRGRGGSSEGEEGAWPATTAVYLLILIFIHREGNPEILLTRPGFRKRTPSKKIAGTNITEK